MKLEEKLLARNLRQQGLSLNEIRRKTGFTKSSISLWVRDIELTENQKKGLSEKGQKRSVIERRRITRLTNENNRRQLIINEAAKKIISISEKELWIVGTSLYWGEGAKTLKSGVHFSNSNPEMIKVIMKFFRKVCSVPEKKFKGCIHIHQHLDYKKAEKYWSSVSGIPLTQFYKTYRKPSISSQSKKDSLPHGTFDIYVCSTELFLKIKGWTEGIYKNIINTPR